MKVAVTGATGFVGSRLVERLHAEGHQILVLSRNLEKLRRTFPPNQFPNLQGKVYTPKVSGEWQRAIAGWDAVVNLAGEPLVGDRWTPDRKQEILTSREQGTAKIVEAIAQDDPKPSVLVNASAIGYYGTSETAVFDETSPPGNDFLAQVCQAWEAAAAKVTETDTRLVILRFGIVLGMGGAIAQMLPPFKLFAGGPIGSGRQWVSWINREDLVALILRALSDPAMAGVYNATTPNPVRMAQFCQTLGEVLQRPSWLPVPALALELLLGDAAMVVLEGQQVQPRHTQRSGFEFQYPELKPALEEFLAGAL